MSILFSTNQAPIRETFSGENESYIRFRSLPNDRIHIDRAFNLSPQGALIRRVMERALRERSTVSASVTWGSKAHLFYLKIGMVPVDFPFSYAAWKYGGDGYEALCALKENNLKPEHLSRLKAILRSNDDYEVLQKKEQLVALLETNKSFLRDYFFPSFLSLLRRDKDFSEGLCSVHMELTEEGRLQWQYAIDTKIPFKPFHRFEHLLPYMTEAQQATLREILK